MPDKPPPPVRATLAEARDAPVPPGQRSAVLMEHGSMRLRYYAPKGEDAQTPHAQDEVYIVVAGRGSFEVAGQTRAFGPDDVLFAPAGAAHRFVDFSDDFATWVVFYGPEGGEGGCGDAGA